MKNSLTNMLLSLGLVGIMSAATLAAVYNVTATPISRAAEKARVEAIAQVLPPFDNLATPIGGSEGTTVTPAYKDNELVGAAVQSYTENGFSGHFDVMVGFDADGAITGYQILSHSETPGLGAKMEEWFKSEEADRSVLGKTGEINVKADGGDIDAITAATITSRAFADAVNRARRAFETSSVKTETR